MTTYKTPAQILNTDVKVSPEKKDFLSTLEKLCHEARTLTCACPHCKKTAIKEYRPEVAMPPIYHCHECNSNFLYLNGVAPRSSSPHQQAT